MSREIITLLLAAVCLVCVTRCPAQDEGQDERIAYAPDAVGVLAELVKEEMQTVMALRVPLKVDVKWGDNWADCEPWAP